MKEKKGKNQFENQKGENTRKDMMLACEQKASVIETDKKVVNLLSQFSC